MRVFRYPMIFSHVFVIFNVDFIGEWRATMGQLHIIKFYTFNNCGYALYEAQKIRIPLAKGESGAGMQYFWFLFGKENHKNWHWSIIFTTRR